MFNWNNGMQSALTGSISNGSTMLSLTHLGQLFCMSECYECWCCSRRVGSDVLKVRSFLTKTPTFVGFVVIGTANGVNGVTAVPSTPSYCRNHTLCFHQRTGRLNGIRCRLEFYYVAPLALLQSLDIFTISSPTALVCCCWFNSMRLQCCQNKLCDGGVWYTLVLEM